MNFQGGLSLEDFDEVEQLLLGKIGGDVFVREDLVLAIVEREVGSTSSSLGTSICGSSSLSFHFQLVFSSNITFLLITTLPLIGLYNRYALDYAQ